MKKINLFLLFVLVLLTGCKREVYLQPVPCTTDCSKPCFAGKEEVCPEVEALTERQVFILEDVKKPTVTYTPLENGNMRRCNQNCHKEHK
ncbi:MAG: hypothetical protein IKW39_05055 [Alphaproteobacteria bacterium]|nr:hypothetical protein [Alphaproteobacteria bacterium]